MNSQMPVDSRTNLASSNLSRNSSRSSWVEENFSFERTLPEGSITQAWQNSLCMSSPTYTMVSCRIVVHQLDIGEGPLQHTILFLPFSSHGLFRGGREDVGPAGFEP